MTGDRIDQTGRCDRITYSALEVASSRQVVEDHRQRGGGVAHARALIEDPETIAVAIGGETEVRSRAPHHVAQTREVL